MVELSPALQIHQSRHPTAVLLQIVDAYGQEIKDFSFLSILKRLCETETFSEKRHFCPAFIKKFVSSIFQSGEDVIKKLKKTQSF